MSEATHQPGEKEFTTAGARFALLGFALTRQARAQDGGAVFLVSRWDQSKTLTRWGDVLAFLGLIGGH